MALSLDQATIPQFLQILPALIGILDKAEAWAKANGVSESEMLGKQLAPDMHSLAAQFRWGAAHSAGAVKAVIDGVFRPDMTPAPEDFATLRGILTDAVSYLQGIDAAQLEDLQDGDVAFEFGGEVRMRFTGSGYLLSFALPNFYFHTSMAYAVLRNLGLEIGKRDFLGAIQVKQPA